jgi:hypothetical protein
MLCITRLSPMLRVEAKEGYPAEFGRSIFLMARVCDLPPRVVIALRFPSGNALKTRRQRAVE